MYWGLIQLFSYVGFVPFHVKEVMKVAIGPEKKGLVAFSLLQSEFSLKLSVVSYQSAVKDNTALSLSVGPHSLSRCFTTVLPASEMLNPFRASCRNNETFQYETTNQRPRPAKSPIQNLNRRTSVSLASVVK